MHMTTNISNKKSQSCQDVYLLQEKVQGRQDHRPRRQDSQFQDQDNHIISCAQGNSRPRLVSRTTFSGNI